MSPILATLSQQPETSIANRPTRHAARNAVRQLDLGDDGTDEEPEEYRDSGGSEYLPSSSDENEDSQPSTFTASIALSDANEGHPSEDSELLSAPTTSVALSDKNEDSCSSEDSNDIRTTNQRTSKEVAITFSKTKKINGKRLRDKHHSCYFCNKILTNNMARHFELVHGKEAEVGKVLAQEKGSKERKRAFEVLVKSGDFYHNLSVLTLKEGELILVRRPDEVKRFTYDEFAPCNYCLGFMNKKYLWVHNKRCNARNKEQRTTHKGPLNESSAMLYQILGPKVNDNFRLEIINTFKSDAVSQVCKEDQLILTLGGFLYEKYGVPQAELIRQSMRQLGRLKIELDNMNVKKASLGDWITTSSFNNIIIATKSICGNDFENDDRTKRNDFKIPSLALKIGHLLRKCIAIESGAALRIGSNTRHTELKAFTELMDLEWAVRISSKALQTMYKQKMNSAQLLPLTSDLLKLNLYLEERLKLLQNLVAHHCNRQIWSNFAALILCRIILFNKRRSGEASKMTLENYSLRPSWEDQGNEEFKNSLTPIEKRLADRLIVVQIRGKRNRTVPVIMTEEIKKYVDLLIATRKQGEISSDNYFVFARSQASKLHSHLRGPDCLRKACIDAGLISAENVTSTKLRKYIATVCQIFDLKENERDWLAKHLGHDIRIHREFYALHESAVELTKVSRLLLAVDRGEAQKFTGKKLQDINIEDLPEIDIEDEIPDNDLPVDEVHEEAVHEVSSTRRVDEFISDPSASIRHSTEIIKKRGRSSAKKPWSNEEVKCVLKYFVSYIKRGVLPGKKECENCISKYTALKNRKWTDLKFYVKNHLTKLNKVKS